MNVFKPATDVSPKHLHYSMYKANIISHGNKDMMDNASVHSGFPPFAASTPSTWYCFRNCPSQGTAGSGRPKSPSYNL